MQLSVIIPCYNAEPWLARCLDSVVGQDFDDMEIICVNDGSTDGTLAILRDYESRYPALMRVIDKPNGGVSSARNAGIDAAQGRWLTFVDADDELVENSFAQIMNKVVNQEGTDPDIIYCGIEIKNRGGDVVKIQHNDVSNTDINIDILLGLDELSIGSPWGKLFNAYLVKENTIRFTLGMSLYEDADFNIRVLSATSRIMLVSDILYIYIRNISSASVRFHGDKFIDCTNRIYKLRKDFFSKKLSVETIHSINRQFAFDYLMGLYMIYRSKGTKKRFKWLRKYWDEAERLYPGWSSELNSGIPKITGAIGRKTKFGCHLWLTMVFGVERLRNKFN